MAICHPLEGWGFEGLFSNEQDIGWVSDPLGSMLLAFFFLVGRL
jgi:hypothetical protein